MIDTQQKMEIVRGTTNAFSISLTDENGAPYEIDPGQVLVFGLKRHLTSSESCAKVKQLHSMGGGDYYLELAPADTMDLEPGLYYYDIGLRMSPNVFHNVIKPSPFRILPNITDLTQIGDGA